MSVKVEDEWRFKKIKSENASKSAFAFMINSRLREGKSSYGYSVKPDYSREVILKITGGARSKKGIKNAVEYISKNWQQEVIDSNGVKYKTKEEIESAVKILQKNVVASLKIDPTKKEKFTHNIIFSPPKIAEVKKEDALDAACKALKEKYPDNYFVAAYHEDTDNPHVHVILNINKDTGKKINIKDKDFHEMRKSFSKNLIEYGYDVKATRKYEVKSEKYEELLSRENRNTYEVVDYGSASYKFDNRNTKNNYLTYRTSNKGEEITIWGKEILDEIMSNGIKIGDQIKIKKEGQVDVKVPVYGNDGTAIISWKDTKRNQWNIEKANNNDNFLKLKRKYSKEIKLNTPERAAKQSEQKQKFNYMKKLFLNSSSRENFESERKIQLKQQIQKLKFNY